MLIADNNTKKKWLSALGSKDEEEVIRSELFSYERLEQHARSLAAAQTVGKNPREGVKLFPRVQENARILRESYREITNYLEDDRSITPAAEWLIDSFHVVEEQLRDIKDHLPASFYRELPKLSEGFLKGYPRVYGLTWAYIAHTDSRFDPELLIRFVRTYQEIEPLTIGELWAIATTLRVVLIENLRRNAVQIVSAQGARRDADRIADELFGLVGKADGVVVTETQKNFFSKPLPRSVHPAFLIQLFQRFRYQDSAIVPALNWLNEQLQARNTTAEELIDSVHKTQAANNLTVRNIITSFRSITSYDWQDFFERVSLVHETLLGYDEYSKMDFTTRDRYSHEVERLGRGSAVSELQIARRVVAKAAGQVEEQVDPGYWLFAGGSKTFEAELGYKSPKRERFIRFLLDYPTVAYLGAIFFVSVLAVYIPLSKSSDLSALEILALIILAAIPASDLAVALVNRMVTELIGPKPLPRLKLLSGPTEEMRTFVVVPTLLGGKERILQQIENLEIHYLSNPDGDLRFALLTDWSDAVSQTIEGDTEQLQIAQAAIAGLNERYGEIGGGPRFFLFHRKRLWNPSEGKWIGWERKRGKLHEFNRLLRGARDTSYLLSELEISHVPTDVRYIITLDADTKLQRGSVSQLVGTLHHKLNQPRFDLVSRKVTRGYGVLQPRVTASLPTREESSIFQRLFSGDCGIDPYSFAVSDVYQDLFGEGSFSGKGIYQLDVFEESLSDRVPENALLSHDLFEGSFARSGFLSDIEVFEDFPSHSEVSSARNHRWIRGDWQLLPWIFGRRGKNLSAISRWKMLDNLRRSLSAVATVLLLVAIFCITALPSGVWIGFVLVTLAGPPLLPFLLDLVPRMRKTSAAQQLRDCGEDFVLGFNHFLVRTFLLAHHAWLHTDAILRALWRLFFSRKHLLEWLTAAQAKSSSSLNLLSFVRQLKGSLVIALAGGIAVKFLNPEMLRWYLPFGVLWFTAPAFARFISLPPTGEEIDPLDAQQNDVLREDARRIWRFFTTFVTAGDGFLPPDNFQEDPAPVVAHRSSPTNFGLYLLSVVAAHDFGWAGVGEMTERLENTLQGMLKLPRKHGHFFNWYETRELRALEPKYISTVDSGNLAGHLLAISQACLEQPSQKVFSPNAITGVSDSLRLLRSSFNLITDDRRTSTIERGDLLDAIEKIEAKLKQQPETPADCSDFWDALSLRAETLRDITNAFEQERGNPEKSEIVGWANQLASDIRSHARDFHTLLPWAKFISRHQILGKISNDEKKHWDEVTGLLSLDLTLNEIPERAAKAITVLKELHRIGAAVGDAAGNAKEIYIDHFVESLEQSQNSCIALKRRLLSLSKTCKQIFNEMDFSFLLDPKKKLLSIGYRVSESELDGSCYDLLASEARLTSYIAIAKGDVPVAHWFRLGRAVTPLERGAALLSWSGSMFEYLMPSLVMYSPRGSLLDQTCRLVVKRQIEYGAERHVPWGISESAYNVRDLELTYQYSNFGIPGLGLKRGLANDLVIAPYATALASMIDPTAAMKNFEVIEKEGGKGPFGFYESMDYTPSRLRENQKAAIVRAYMAHHQGMALISFANIIHQGLMRRRFHTEPLVQAAELLLQEKTPRNFGTTATPIVEVEVKTVQDVHPVTRRLHSPHHAIPSSHILSNGHYSVMITAAGSGYSRWRDLAVTRWREDVTRDGYGSYIYLRDLSAHHIWSAAFQPTMVPAEENEMTFSEDRAKIARVEQGIFSELEIIVSPEDDVEIRRLSLTNLSNKTREIEITSYAEVVLAPQAADRAHPAFSNLFIQTEFIPAHQALLAARRPRSSKEKQVFMAQVLSLDSHAFGGTEYETDRARFIGRDRSLNNPVSIFDGRPLSNTVGPVLDPIFSIRTRVRIPPGEKAQVSFSTIASDSREYILERIEKYRNSAAFERTSTLAWTQAQARLHYLGIEPDETQVFQKLANRILYSDPLMRPASEVLKLNQLNVTYLWGKGISGDLPIILVRVDDPEDHSLVRHILRAHEYWRMKGIAVDVVILNEKATSYAQELQLALEAMVRGSLAATQRLGEALGKVFILRNDLLNQQERELLLSVSRAILSNRDGSLFEQVMRSRKIDPVAEMDSDKINDKNAAANIADPAPPQEELEYFNGLGGFGKNGREYVIILGKGQRTPAPWINVISNAQFGFQVSESGSGYTWSQNSRENQMTPWSNDAVSDPSGEAIYIRDLESNRLWSPTAQPIRVENATYIGRHGTGYSTFETSINEVRTQLTQFVSLHDSVKVSKLVLKNLSTKTRSLAISSYVEWVLGFSRSMTAAGIATEVDPETGAILATNPLLPEFGKRVSFLAFQGKVDSHTGDRTEFIGRNGTLQRPSGLFRTEGLSGNVGAGRDPCGAVSTNISLKAGEQKELVFYLGQAENRDEALALIRAYRKKNESQELDLVIQNWDKILRKVQVQTPDRSMDLLLNTWLLYQTLSCRFWARSAFYQAGGAFGFRDQLQDVMAIMGSDPELARTHILRAASRQFVEGDVQHWWHPPTGRGVRTHFSDDLLWLPYVLDQYVSVTGDKAILDAPVSFIDGPLLRDDQEDAYFEPGLSHQPQASVYEHCARTLDRSLKVGVHGLPLIGSGDWNDGMNRVGHDGKGESVWVAWFLHKVLSEFAPVARARGETERADKWTQHTLDLKKAIEENAWDGNWYRRAYFDDGTPLGSASNVECRIDSIAQTWSVLSGAGDPARAIQAMASVDRFLIRPSDELILLFSPPFNNTPTDPGYIKGYLPGVRENGGQYTHAAVWTVCAYAKLGMGDRASELFSMLNPIEHASSRTGVQTYKVEPYVMAADIYGESPHIGRGGWTWYTGSSSWMYRAGVEYILGLHPRGEKLFFDPCIPHDWKQFKIFYKNGSSRYEIQFENPTQVQRGILSIEVDGRSIDPLLGVDLLDDSQYHLVKVRMGEKV
jgi:cyclic beta-1,2-glucan synthetase